MPRVAEVLRGPDDSPLVTEPMSSMTTIQMHREQLSHLSDQLDRAMRHGDVSAAPALAQVMADLAVRHHAGVFTDLVLERSLTAMSASIVGPVGLGRRSASLLQVVSPHARTGVDVMVERLADAAADTTLRFVTDPDAPLESANRLRRLAAVAETVAVHADPDDVIPTLALAGWRDRPRVAHVNHHDTVFWVGASIADVVVSHRATGSALAVDRRFVAPGRTMVAPPLDAPADAWSSWFASMLERLRSVHRAWLPEAGLPAPVTERDLELAMASELAGRADGLRGAYGRHGSGLGPPHRPAVSLVILGHDIAATLDCLDSALSALGETHVQVMVVDVADDDEFHTTMGDLSGILSTLTPPEGCTELEAASHAVRWCAAPLSVVVSDHVVLSPASLLDGLTDVEFSTQPVILDDVGGDPRSVCFATRTSELDGWLDLLQVAGHVGEVPIRR